MKNRRLVHGCAVLVSLVFLLALLTGCGAKQEPDAQNTDGQQTAAPTPPAATQTPPAESGALRVGSVEELVEAIRPGAEIIIEPGRYDLMDFLADIPHAEDREVWNDAHEYVRIEGTFEGAELIIQNVTGLRIEGGSEDPGDTEIVTQPRHATVLGFQDCSDIELACLTMGHTDGGECNGNVLDFFNCQNVCLRTMDLYGCGVFGISALGGCGDLAVSNSTLRDCSDGPFDICDASGAFTFTACTLAGSEGAGGYSGEDGASLSFVGCSFGQEESNSWYWYNTMHLDDSITFEDCQWTEVTRYPDLDPGYEDFYSDYNEPVPDFDADAMTEISFDSSTLSNTYWVGHSAVNPQSGDIEYFADSDYESVYGEFVHLLFYGNGTACLAYRGETLELEWDMTDEGLARLENAEHSLYVSLYRDSEGAAYCWLRMQYDDELIWFYG